ncbi:MAG TPA: oxidoreductase [Rhodocyclaceae bacterium]|nr:oxidoreductase [Rhodocyclaceae bacterium]
MTRKALIVGASGLVGGHLLDALLGCADYGAVTALLRHPLEIQQPKLTQRIVDFEHLDANDFPPVDDVFCCLGTTIKQAGSREAFYRVDHHYIHEVARLARQAGAQQFLLVSSMGANAASKFFYMRVKGETEAAIRLLAYPSASMFRPAYLAGQRKQQRPLEDLSGKLMQAIGFLMPQKYRPVAARAVAEAMLTQALHNPAGFHIIESDLNLNLGSWINERTP